MTPETKERGAAVKPVGPNQAHYACAHAVHISYTHIHSPSTVSSVHFIKRNLGCFSADLPRVKCGFCAVYQGIVKASWKPSLKDRFFFGVMKKREMSPSVDASERCWRNARVCKPVRRYKVHKGVQ